MGLRNSRTSILFLYSLCGWAAISVLIGFGWVVPTQQQAQEKVSPKVVFLYLAGLEGTGHHWMNSILPHSPSAKFINSLAGGKIQKKITQLSWLLLYDHGMGAFYSHCNLKDKRRGTDKVTFKMERETRRTSATGNSTSALPAQYSSVDALLPHVNQSYDTAVKLLRSIDQSLKTALEEQSSTEQQSQTLFVPLNADGFKGEMLGSYPQDSDSCRSLKYPELDVLLESLCKDADVDCGFLYMYRDPYEIVRSTLQRKFNKDIRSAAHLYVTMLRTLYEQVQSLGTHHTYGCLGPFDVDYYKSLSRPDGSVVGDNNNTAINTAIAMGPLFDEIATMFGTNPKSNNPSASVDQFRQQIAQLYRPPHPLTEADRRDFVWNATKQDAYYFHDAMRYMDRMTRIHDRVLDVCREQQQQQQQLPRLSDDPTAMSYLRRQKS